MAKKAPAKKTVALGPPLKKQLPPTTSLTGGVAPATEPRLPGTPYQLPRKLPGGALPAGRPPKVGEYIISPTPNQPSGFEMLNDQPDLIDKVHKDFLKSFQLPPALQPKYLRRPQAMEQGPTGRATNISRGWRKPKSWQG